MPNKNVNLKETQEKFQKTLHTYARRVVICAGTGCMANGSLRIYDAMCKEIASKGLHVDVALSYEHDNVDDKGILLTKSGCQGFCQVGPLVTIEPDNIMYIKVTVEDVPEIVEKTFLKNEVVERLVYKDPATQKAYKGTKDIPFYVRQNRQTLKECGLLNPEDIREYIAHGGYEGARKAYCDLEPIDVCNMVEESGLRGRGGGGFPTGRKWKFALPQPGNKKYIICNADEGDPGAFMDRSVMEGNPHSVIEGMLIAGRAIGADEGWVYIRIEYPLAVERVNRAIRQAEEWGFLGDDAFGTGHAFHINVMEGAGAFVCGEETALIASIEGERGMPRSKPPFPAVRGLWGKPTCINNVETLATVPLVLRHGVEKFRSLGTEKSPGTKTFALTGHVANTGLIEVPFGITLREIIFDIGGGVLTNSGKIDNNAFKAVQIGGPSGGCLTKEHLDMPLDFDSLSSIGAMVGSGGLVVMNNETCIVQIARFFMQFTQNESCGKCIPCRTGTREMLYLLDEIIEGRGTLETLDLLEKTGHAVQDGALCGLGKTAPNPVLSTMKYFREEYEQHVVDKVCPTKHCKALTTYKINPDKCKGCTACARMCPVNAITGEVRKPHTIDTNLCIKCGRCYSTCKFGAIE